MKTVFRLALLRNADGGRMEQDKDLAAYCARVLGMLKMNVSGTIGGSSDVIHVYVNERRVGALGGREAESSLQFQRQGCVDHIQLRSEDGAILGSLSAPEFGFRAVRISLAEGTVELHIRNTAEGGSASAVFTPAPRRWSGLLRTVAESAQAIVARQGLPVVAPGMRMVVVMQALLVVIVLGLAADRIAVWIDPERKAISVTRDEAPWAAPLDEVAKLEQQLHDLARMQAKTVDTIQSQQQGMAQLQLAIVKLSTAQETVASRMLTVRQEIEKRQKSSGRELKKMTQFLMSQAQMDQEQLEAEIHSLTVANERLSEEMAGLVEQNQDLEKKLKSAGLEVSEAIVTHQENAMLARQSDSQHVTTSPPLAEVQGNDQPFLFWVNFSDGATQESIDQWMHEMQGRKGAINEGWHEVEVVQPTIPTDRFLEQVRGAKIVKAVRVSR